MAPKAPAGKAAPKGEVVCEPGRHVDCLHAKMAESRKTR
jgi:hypothetical protein